MTQFDKLIASSYRWKITRDGTKSLAEIFKVVKIASVVNDDLELAIAEAISAAERDQ